MAEAEKTVAGKYQIIEEVGRGGMAIVYKAFDQSLHRAVAVKVLYPHLAERKEHKMRFQREARVVARVRHKNIVEIYDYSGMDSESTFIVTEFIDGFTLKHFMADHPVLVAEVAAMMVEQICLALSHAHANGVIHRDVKPENVMVGRDGLLKLMDFGIAQIKDMQHMTVTGTMIGSPAHMSPEHIEGKDLDHRADIFSLGTVFYTLCVGRLPFEGGSAHALLRNILEVNYVPAIRANPAVGGEISGLIDRCLRRRPEDRFQSCDELRSALLAALVPAGLEDTQKELAAFFADPDAFERSLKTRLVDDLVKKGRGLARSRKVGLAMRCFDRALCLDESRSDIVREVDRLRRREELKRVGLRYVLPGLAAAVLLSAGTWVVTQTELLGSLSSRDEVPAGPPDSRQARWKLSSLRQPRGAAQPGVGADAREADRDGSAILEPGPIDGPAASLLADEGPMKLLMPWQSNPQALRPVRALPDIPPGQLPRAPVRDEKGVSAPPGQEDSGNGTPAVDPKAAALVPVTIDAWPPAVEILVDDDNVGTGRVVDLMLKPGIHKLSVHHPNCAVCVDHVEDLEVRPGATSIKRKVRIGFLPARLTVESATPGLVFVDGSLKGRTNQPLEIPAASPQPWRVSVKVVFDDKALPPFEGSCQVSAGSPANIKAVVPAPSEAGGK